MACTVKFCSSNYINGSYEIKEIAEKNPEIIVEEDYCLGNCGQCMTESFAVVNQTPVAIEKYEELLKKIEAK
ncbi:DUF1450 domain-containing protein [Bacillus taeanensis]|nr:DUF1450 domain-containing protein [Bacillus taeanensis]